MNLLLRTSLSLVVVVSLACVSPAQQPAAGSEAPGVSPQAQQPPGLDSQTSGSQQPANPPPATPQSTPQPPAPNAQQPTNPAPTEEEKEIQKKEQSQRILGVAPQFSVTSRQNAPALTPGQKFHLFVKSSFDPFQFAAAAFQAGISQATDAFSGYGQGAAGYSKRFGAAFTDQVSSNFFSNYFYPVLLKEDPRYFRLGEGTIKHRILYSLAQEFVTKTDKGTRRFNFSNALGAFTSGALSNAYYPQSDRGFGLTMSRSAVALAYGSAGGLIDEFWFDINQKLFHKHKKKPVDVTPPATPPPPAPDH
jgi:hypothetical protein